ncbi:MAG: acylase [Bacteroidetes bacterium]|nr:acylase [Bacteroidota bacterium]
MNRALLTLSILLFASVAVQSQIIDPVKIDIVRDKWGVPHIFAPTDAGVAYGLAWAHAEDDFETIQKGFMAGKSMLGEISGKEGATIDYIVHFLRCREIVDSRYDTDLSADFKKVLEAYAQGLNAYAAAHPHEVLLKKLFPLTPKEMLRYSVLQLVISAGVDGALRKINDGTVELAQFQPGGSNAYAFNSKKTADGNVYLAINSHQPLEGPVSWYEAHLCSEEGWNILGALFPGAPSILHGCNEYLGWAHTVNNPDKTDVYQLELNPQNTMQYKLDGEWQTLQEETVRLKVKVGGIKIGVKKKIYNSKFGPTMVTKRGAFAIRTAPFFDIRALEQWWRMNKAKNFTQFKKAIDMGALPGYNVVYADRYDTIYYLSNGKLPIRKSGYNWESTLPGNTSETLWNQFHSISDLPQYLNPASGYLFNSNHSPFNGSAANDNLSVKNFDPTMGYETNENNRSKRFMQLISTFDKINFEQFKQIKYDLRLPDTLFYRTKADSLFLLDERKYPDIQEQIKTLRDWDRNTDINSKGAALFGIIYYKVVGEQAKGAAYRSLYEAKAVQLVRDAKEYLMKYFGRTNISLAEYQKLVRGNKEVALPGLPDVISSMRSMPYKDGRVKGEQGESYIELVKFTKDGPEIETINCYGASNKADSPHYADQMELFVQQKTKPMTLDKKKVYAEAVKVYHPQ